MATNRTFGIELEFFLPRGKKLQQLAEFINDAGIPCTYAGYTHRVSDCWKIVTDSSLDEGAGKAGELVSPVLSGEDGFRQVRTAAKALRDFGCFVNLKCGFHVHIGAADFSVEQMSNLMLLYVWFEDFFDHIVSPSRRRDDSRWINSNRHFVGGGYGTDAVNACFPIIKAALAQAEGNKINSVSPYRYMPAFRDGTRDYAMETLIYAFTRERRYVKLNLFSGYLPGENRPGNKCAEFRQHQGTLDSDKICNWIALKLALVEKSKTSKPRPRTVTRELTPVEEMNRFFAFIPVAPEVKAFFMARRKDLAGEAAATVAAAALDFANGEAIANEMIAALNARRDVVLSYARPQRRVAYRLDQAIRILTRATTGTLPWGATSRPECIAGAIRQVRALNLLPAPRAARRPRAERVPAVALAA